MSDLEPITRNEKLWSGENLEPKTRREMYIRHLYDETQVIPDSPKTREEMFILKAGEELHDVTIEQLTATENGTYSEAGVAYSPVIVNVPAPVLDELTVTENGTYTPSSGTDGYNEVNVNVQPTLAMKNITANGTYTASDDNADGYSSVSVNVPLPSNAYLLKSIENEQVATFTDGTDNFLKSLEVGIEPQQDLHGYDSPWVGGAGKNKLQTTATSQTVNGVTFTINSDGTIKATGKATASVWFVIDATNWDSYSTLANKGFNSSLILNGCPSGGSGSTYALGMRSGNSSNLLDVGNGVAITNLDTNTYYPAILISNGYEIPSGGLLFKPMLRLSTVTDATFAPYSNICPISGWSAVDVTKCGKNLIDVSKLAQQVVTPQGDLRPGVPVRLDAGTYTISAQSGNLPFYITRPINNYSYISINALPFTFSLDNEEIVIVRIAQLDISSWNYVNLQLEEGNTATAYEPYNGSTITIQLGDTYYGGKLDVVSGVLTVDRGYIASYNGETLPSTWISDRDVYAEGTTPTTGAEVCYKLATPQTIQLTPTIIKSLQMGNNFLASTGEIELLQYWAKEVM